MPTVNEHNNIRLHQNRISAIRTRVCGGGPYYQSNWRAMSVLLTSARVIEEARARHLSLIGEIDENRIFPFHVGVCSGVPDVHQPP
jgi:hypothetical protein